MNIRSLTIGAALPSDQAARASLIARLGDFARSGRAALEAAGFTVQTVRLSTQPVELWLSLDGDGRGVAAELGRQCAQSGIDYCSLGTIQTESGDKRSTAALQDSIPGLLMAAENVFASI